MARRKLDPVHPGEILIEDFLKPLGITQYRLAKAVGVSQRRIGEIVQGKRAISADTAIRLGQALGTSAQFWMNLQSRYELERAADEIGGKARRIERLVA
jgi:addiction module HigA family antidote